MPKRELDEFQNLMHKAQVDSQYSEGLQILKSAAQSLIRAGRGGKEYSLVETVEHLLARRTHLSPEVSAALREEWHRRRLGEFAPSECEQIELLKLLINPQSHAGMPPNTLKDDELNEGLDGGGGARLPPPKLLPFQPTALPPAVLQAAHREFERKYARPPRLLRLAFAHRPRPGFADRRCPPIALASQVRFHHALGRGRAQRSAPVAHAVREQD